MQATYLNFLAVTFQKENKIKSEINLNVFYFPYYNMKIISCNQQVINIKL